MDEYKGGYCGFILWKMFVGFLVFCKVIWWLKYYEKWFIVYFIFIDMIRKDDYF